MCTIPETANRSRTAGSTARSSAMRSARTSGASRRKSVSMRAPIAARATRSGSRAPAPRDSGVRDLESARGDEDAPCDRHRFARRCAAALHGHGCRHGAAGPAHLRTHVRARRGGILELRAPAAAMRRIGATARVVRRLVHRDARAGYEERAERRVRAVSLERSERGEPRPGENRGRGLPEKSCHETRGIGEHGERDERHRSPCDPAHRRAASTRRGCNRASASGVSGSRPRAECRRARPPRAAPASDPSADRAR